MAKEYEGLTAVLYARVSTDDKDQRPESQMEMMESWCKDQGIIIVGRFLEEKSGKDLDRPQFQQALGRIIAGSLTTVDLSGKPNPDTCKVNLLVAWHITRISRDQTDFMNLSKTLGAMGCNIRFVSSMVQPETSEGKLLSSIDAWHGEMERKKLSENTKMGMRQRKANGQHISKPLRVVFQEDIDNGMYSLKGMVRTDEFVKHKTRITTEQDVYSWASEGLSIKKVALEKLYVPYTTFYTLLEKTGRLEKYKSIYHDSRRGNVEKGAISAISDTIRGGGDDIQ